MLGIKGPGSIKTASLILVLLLLAVLVISRYSNVLLKFAVGQEINLKTAHFSVTETEHFKIKYTSVDQDYVPMICRASEQAYQSVSEVFGQESQGKTVIVVYPDTASLAASFGWERDQKAMGVYWGGSIRILSPREWVGPAEAEEVFAQEGPMVHEFAHLMVDEITQGNYNRWWTEGVAQYVEKNITGFEFADPFSGGRTPYYYEMDSLERSFDSLNQQVAYWQSFKIVEYLVDKYGQECLFDIMKYLGQGLNMKQAIERTLDVDYSSFENDLYYVLDGNGREG